MKFGLCGLRLFMAKDYEIVLLKSSFSLDSVSEKADRDRLISTVSELSSSALSEEDLRRYFKGIQLALGAFAKKIEGLESEVLELKRDQLATEARMESMYLKAQLEIQQLRSEILEVRLSKGRINQIVRVAKVLQGNAYAPYAVKSMVDGVIGQSSSSAPSTTYQTTKLPSDFESRLRFAQDNGFKWNQNNRKPNKPAKQLSILETWEDQFCSVESMTIDQILDRRYVRSVGQGAVAGALMYLERELGPLLPERKTLSVFNCYQRAARIYNEKLSAQTPCIFDLKSLVSDGFANLSGDDITKLVKRLESKDLGSVEHMILSIKKVVSKSILPSFIAYEEDSDTQQLYAIQSGKYDQLIRNMCEKYSLVS